MFRGHFLKLEDLYQKAFGQEDVNFKAAEALLSIFMDEVLEFRHRMSFPKRILKCRQMEKHERLVINGKRTNTFILQCRLRFDRGETRAVGVELLEEKACDLLEALLVNEERVFLELCRSCNSPNFVPLSFPTINSDVFDIGILHPTAILAPYPIVFDHPGYKHSRISDDLTRMTNPKLGRIKRANGDEVAVISDLMRYDTQRSTQPTDWYLFGKPAEVGLYCAWPSNFNLDSFGTPFRGTAEFGKIEIFFQQELYMQLNDNGVHVAAFEMQTDKDCEGN